MASATVIALAVVVAVLAILLIVALVMWVRYRRRSDPDRKEREKLSFAERMTGCRNKRTDYPYNYQKLPNEKRHQTFKGEDGCLYAAQWSGPGTQVLPKLDEWWARHNGDVERIIDESNFANPVDRVAMRHDLEYLLAGDEEDPQKSYDMVRRADEAFIETLAKMRDDDKFNVFVPLNALRAKVGLEKRGMKQYKGSEAFENDEQRQKAKILAAELARVLQN